MRRCLKNSILALVAMALWGASVVPAEGSRRHAFRAPTPEALPAPTEAEREAAGEAAAETVEVVGEPTETQPAPRRSFFDFLFGRKGAAATPPQAEELVIDERMIEAARLAERSARRRSINRCWRFVKRALKEAELVECYPKTALAKQAAQELPERYGFQQIDVEDPHDAPVGSVLVYGGRGAGHVEIRTETGFVSDHASLRPSPRPLIGVFVKPAEEG